MIIIFKTFIKSVIKFLHYKWLRLIHNKPILMTHASEILAEIKTLSSSKGAIFFGYHDKTPFNQNGNKILAHFTTENEHSIESECKTIDIGFFQKGNDGHFINKFIKVSTTTTWSWQQGSMLQWDPLNPQDQIIFNDIIEGKYGAKVYNINTNKVIKTYNRPIYALSKNGKYAVSMNFSRLSRIRSGYGYRLISDLKSDDPSPKDDGLFLIDMKTGQSRLIVSLDELANKLPKNLSSEHYLNHSNFSPDSKFISFFHIWNEMGSSKRKIRLYIYNILSNSLQLLEEDRLVSHYDWKGNNTLLVTNRDEKLKWYYSLYNVNDLSRTDLNIPLGVDGHPMSNPTNENIFVTDSSPDKRLDQHLILLDTRTEFSVEVKAFFSPRRFNGPVRCDLHPRWDRTGKYICIDSAYNGKREMVLLKLSSLRINK